jgi:hypothetical protein
MYFFAGFFFESHPVYDHTKTQGPGAVFFLLYTDNSNVKAKEIATGKENSKNLLELYGVDLVRL